MNETATDKGHYDVLVFCDNALITRKLRIGSAIIMPCRSQSNHSLVDQIRRFCKEVDIFIPEGIIEKQLDAQKDRFKPSFVVCFMKLPIWHIDKLIAYLRNEMKIILGIIALNRMAYPSEIAVAYLRREGDQVDGRFIKIESYYRGNLAGGIISGAVHPGAGAPCR